MVTFSIYICFSVDIYLLVLVDGTILNFQILFGPISDTYISEPFGLMAIAWGFFRP